MVREPARPDLRQLRGDRGRVRRRGTALATARPGGFEPRRRGHARPTKAKCGARRGDERHARTGVREGRRERFHGGSASSAPNSAAQIPGAEPRTRGSGPRASAWSSHMQKPARAGGAHEYTAMLVTTSAAGSAAAATSRPMQAGCAGGPGGRGRFFIRRLPGGLRPARPRPTTRNSRRWCDALLLPAAQERAARRGRHLLRPPVFSGNAEADFAFTRDVGDRVPGGRIPSQIVQQACCASPGPRRNASHQLVRRGRYVEFNLLL